jgi:hypothetical protein
MNFQRNSSLPAGSIRISENRKDGKFCKDGEDEGKEDQPSSPNFPPQEENAGNYNPGNGGEDEIRGHFPERCGSRWSCCPY